MSEPTQTTALATRQPTQLASGYQVKGKWDYCNALSKSDLLPEQYVGKPGNIFMAVELGEALGLTPMIAILNTHFIKGRPGNSAQIVAALVRRAGHTLRISGDENQATCQIVRADDPGFTYTTVWTMDKAKRAGLLDKTGSLWRTYPGPLLKARAITECARDACQDLLNGMGYTPEELESPGPENQQFQVQASFIGDAITPKDTAHGQRFIELARAQFGGNKEAFSTWISEQFGGKLFGHLTEAEMQAGGDLLASMSGTDQIEEAELVDDAQPQEDHGHEQRRFFAVLKERGLESEYEGAVCWWAGRDCGWPIGAKGRPSLSLAPAYQVKLAATMLQAMDTEQIADILEDYRCSKLDQTKEPS